MRSKRRQELIDAYAEWLARYSWDWFGTLTFAIDASVLHAKRKFSGWITEIRKAVGGRNFRYVAAVEHGAHADNVHLHVLIGGVKKGHELWPYRWKARWQEVAGQAVLSNFDPKQGGVRYLLKTLWPDRDFELLIELPHTGNEDSR